MYLKTSSNVNAPKVVKRWNTNGYFLNKTCKFSFLGVFENIISNGYVH